MTSSLTMDVIPILPHHQNSAGGKRTEPDGLPFQHKNVKEWSQLDELTGMLEHGRLELDHWAASGNGASHKYGKVVDDRSRNFPDGSMQQRQKKQFEVFQSQVSGGSLQVIRTRSISSTNTSSGFSLFQGNSPSSTRSSNNSLQNNGFGNLQLTLNPLDVSPQKTKATVGRSGSISGRRPPSRQRNANRASNADEDFPLSPFSSELTLSIGDKEDKRYEASENMHSGKHWDSDISDSTSEFSLFNSALRNKIERQSEEMRKNHNSNHERVEKKVADSLNSIKASLFATSYKNLEHPHGVISRRKSSSSENLDMFGINDKESIENSDDKIDPWKRSPMARRSLQFSPSFTVNFKNVSSQNNDSEHSKNVSHSKKFIADFFNDSTKFKKANELNQIRSERSGYMEDCFVDNSHSLHISEQSDDDGVSDEASRDSKLKNKRSSIVTVESLNEVRKNLRRLDSPLIDKVQSNVSHKNDKGDIHNDRMSSFSKNVSGSHTENDLACIDSTSFKSDSSKMSHESGSLGSKTSQKYGNNGSAKLEEWYNRRRSYGFEPLSSPETIKQPLLTAFREKNKIESSTDSGICRSSETMNGSWEKSSKANKIIQESLKNFEDKSQIHSHMSSFYNNKNEEENKLDDQRTYMNHHINRSNILKPVMDTGGKEYSNDFNSYFKKEESSQNAFVNNKKQTLEYSNKHENDDIEQTKKNIVDIKRQLFENLAKKKHSQYYAGESPNKLLQSSNGVTRREPKISDKSREFKRHSIATDEPRYLHAKFLETSENETHESIQNFSVKDAYLSSAQKYDHDKESLPVTQTLIQSKNNIHDKFEEFTEKDTADDSHEQNGIGKKAKKVEFCKTEVHFAAEPGRFNIIETDEKPPPTNMFRRRRRNSNPSVPTNRGNLPELHFGDSPYEISLLGITENKIQNLRPLPSLPISTNASKAFNSTSESQPMLNKYTEKEENFCTESNATFSPGRKQFDDSSDKINFESNALKHEAAYTNSSTDSVPNKISSSVHINSKTDNESNSTSAKLWGVKLKPIKKQLFSVSDNESSHSYFNTETAINKYSLGKSDKSKKDIYTKSSDIVMSEDNICDIETEPFEALKTSSFHINIGDKFKVPSTCSVAERIRQAESNTQRSKCFSTKINFKGGEAFVVQPDKQDNKFSIQEEKVKVPSEQQNYSASKCDITNEALPTNQISVATAVLPSYKSESALKSVETLVSTKSGKPRITFISLRYDDEHDKNIPDSTVQETYKRPESHVGQITSYPDDEQHFITFKNETIVPFNKPSSKIMQQINSNDIYKNSSSSNYQKTNEQVKERRMFSQANTFTKSAQSPHAIPEYSEKRVRQPFTSQCYFNDNKPYKQSTKALEHLDYNLSTEKLLSDSNDVYKHAYDYTQEILTSDEKSKKIRGDTNLSSYNYLLGMSNTEDSLKSASHSKFESETRTTDIQGDIRNNYKFTTHNLPENYDHEEEIADSDLRTSDNKNTGLSYVYGDTSRLSDPYLSNKAERKISNRHHSPRREARPVQEEKRYIIHSVSNKQGSRTVQEERTSDHHHSSNIPELRSQDIREFDQDNLFERQKSEYEQVERTSDLHHSSNIQDFRAQDKRAFDEDHLFEKHKPRIEQVGRKSNLQHLSHRQEARTQDKRISDGHNLPKRHESRLAQNEIIYDLHHSPTRKQSRSPEDKRISGQSRPSKRNEGRTAEDKKAVDPYNFHKKQDVSISEDEKTSSLHHRPHGQGTGFTKDERKSDLRKYKKHETRIVSHSKIPEAKSKRYETKIINDEREVVSKVKSKSRDSSRTRETNSCSPNLKEDPTLQKTITDNLSNNREKTDEEILAELTLAADQILHAVNGYTDEESNKASSDDNDDKFDRRGKRKIQMSQSRKTHLNTIHESSSTKKTDKRSSEIKAAKSNRARISHKPSSSTSSVDSFIMENSQKILTKDKPVMRREYRKRNSLERSKTASDSSSKAEKPSQQPRTEPSKNISEMKTAHKRQTTSRYQRRYTSGTDSDRNDNNSSSEMKKSSRRSVENIYTVNNSTRTNKESSSHSRMKTRSDSQSKPIRNDAGLNTSESHNRSRASRSHSSTADSKQMKSSENTHLIHKGSRQPTRPRVVKSGVAVSSDKVRRKKTMSQESIVANDKSETKS